jgi:hypothetical protein
MIIEIERDKIVLENLIQWPLVNDKQELVISVINGREQYFWLILSHFWLNLENVAKLFALFVYRK